MSILRVPVTPADHIQGPKHAAVTLVEYGDYECGYCGLAHPVVKQVQKHFGDELRFVFRHFPLTQIHPHAQSAAETAEFAGAHKQFWPMHDGIYENQDRLSIPTLFTLADALRLSAIDLRDALEIGRFTPKVRSDFLGGVRSGVNGTPTFFVAGRRHDAPFDFEYLVAAIDAARVQLQAAAT
jgi:protein-disulfide isomerase